LVVSRVHLQHAEDLVVVAGASRECFDGQPRQRLQALGETGDGAEWFRLVVVRHGPRFAGVREVARPS
jgi:hypothetical protein